jgi:hypothetical protein
MILFVLNETMEELYMGITMFFFVLLGVLFYFPFNFHRVVSTSLCIGPFIRKEELG